jgi:hypothetical protein
MSAEESSCAACMGTSDKNLQSYSSIAQNPQCHDVCPDLIKNMGSVFDDPLASTIDGFVGDSAYWNDDASEGYSEDNLHDRDASVISHVRSKGLARETAAVPFQLSRGSVWGGALNRVAPADLGSMREDERYYDDRNVSLGFARYQSPVINPNNYRYYMSSGWRVAVLRSTPLPEVRALLVRLYQYAPEYSGYVRLGDTLVPASLAPGDRQALARTQSQAESGSHSVRF